MTDLIITSPEDLKTLLKETLLEILSPEGNSSLNDASGYLTVKDAVNFLQESGLPTSKAKIYKLTSSSSRAGLFKKPPHHSGSIFLQ